LTAKFLMDIERRWFTIVLLEHLSVVRSIA